MSSTGWRESEGSRSPSPSSASSVRRSDSTEVLASEESRSPSPNSAATFVPREMTEELVRMYNALQAAEVSESDLTVSVVKHTLLYVVRYNPDIGDKLNLQASLIQYQKSFAAFMSVMVEEQFLFF